MDKIKTESHPPIVLRQSIVYLTLRLIVLQILFICLYLLFLFPLNFFPFSSEIKVIVFPIASVFFIALLLMQMCLTLFIMLSWLGEYYVIRPGEILLKSGILLKKEKIYLLDHIETITCNQSLVERILNYGTIQLYNAVIRQYIHIDCIKNPDKYIKIIENAMSVQPNTGKSDIIMPAPAERIVYVH